MAGEKKKPKPEKTAGGGADNPFSEFDSATSNMATVTHGPYAQSLPVAGMTVEQVRDQYSAQFDIDPTSDAFIEGNPVKADHVIAADEVLMFTRQAGEKG